MGINWQQFGLKTNPYNTNALVEGGELSIEDAFIGRNQERKVLNDIFASDTKVCLAVCGETGVGKTTLANSHKFLWKYKREKLLFSCRREIEASDTLLNKQSFLLEIIGSILREINLLDANLSKDPLLSKLLQIVDVSQTIAISTGASVGIDGFGGGLNFQRDRKNSLPIRFSMASLEQHFIDLLNFIKTHPIKRRQYQGIIIHVNNFDFVLKDSSRKKEVLSFFNEIRDILQTKDAYFLFLGPSDFYSQIIAKEQRVKSVFERTPLLVRPLGKTEVIEALEKRMELLKSEDVSSYIKPIDDEVVSRLYSLYNGDIRSIMTGLKDILGQCESRLLQPLSVNEAMLLLGRERWEKIGKSLTSEQKNILKFLVTTNKYASGKEISEILGKTPSNMSGYYFPPLKNLGIIEQKEKKGTRIYFGLTTEYEPLKWWLESQENIRNDVQDAKVTQSALFT